jgi:microcompartment protein CcmL/EutN
MAPGWYPAEAGRLRYFDGTVWTGTVKADPGADPVATYGAKFTRRLPIVLTVVAAVSAVVSLLLYLNPPTTVFPGSAPGWLRGVAIAVYLVSIVLGALFWTAIASLFRGRVMEPAPRRTGLLVVGAVGAVLAAVVAGLQSTPTVVIETPPIASPAEGCQAFLTTFDSVAQQNLPDAAARPYFTSLADAARTNDPELATDVDAIVAATTPEGVQTAAQTILTRCVTNGLITEAELTTWLDTLETYGS